MLSCVNSGETLALLMRIFDLGSGSLALGSGSLAIDACYEVVSKVSSLKSKRFHPQDLQTFRFSLQKLSEKN